jgi:hypothetical protein
MEKRKSEVTLSRSSARFRTETQDMLADERYSTFEPFTFSIKDGTKRFYT